MPSYFREKNKKTKTNNIYTIPHLPNVYSLGQDKLASLVLHWNYDFKEPNKKTDLIQISVTTNNNVKLWESQFQIKMYHPYLQIEI